MCVCVCVHIRIVICSIRLFTHKKTYKIRFKKVSYIMSFFSNRMHQTFTFTSYILSRQVDKGCLNRSGRTQDRRSTRRRNLTEGRYMRGTRPSGLASSSFSSLYPVARPVTSSEEPDRFRQRQ